MTWTYSGNPSASDLDAVRFAIGDTVSADPLLTDEEIAYLLVDSTVNSAALGAARGLAARFARDVDRQVGNLRISASQRSKAFTALADSLEAIIATGNRNALPYAGGISYAEKDEVYADTDRIPSFTRRASYSESYGPDLYGSR